MARGGRLTSHNYTLDVSHGWSCVIAGLKVFYLCHPLLLYDECIRRFCRFVEQQGFIDILLYNYIYLYNLYMCICKYIYICVFVHIFLNIVV